MYAYPARTSFCSCKRKQNTLGDTPRPYAPERPLGKPKGGFPKRGLNGAYRVSATHFYRPRAGARRANHHPSLALVAPKSHCFACSLALLLSLPKELSLFPPPAALQFLAPQRRGTMVRVDKHFLVYFPCFRQIYLPHPLTATHCRPRFFRKASPRLAAGTWGIFQPSRPFSSSASAFSTAMRPSRSVFTCVLWNGVTAPSSARSR